MNFNWKIPAVAAGGAFLLSLIIGAAGRVTFGIVMLRAFIWAAVFAALVFGVDFLLRKYLPELFAGETGASAEGERAVDITLEEENPVSAGKTEAGGGSVYRERGADEADEADDMPESAGGENAATGPAEADGLEGAEDAGEPEELTDDVEAMGSIESAETAGGEFSDFQSVENAFDTSGDSVRPEPSRRANIDLLGIDEDPATVAKAVRTFMKKDQEG